MHQTTITTKIIAVQTLILEDAADIEDNILDMTEAYSTKCTIGFCRILQEWLIGQKVCVKTLITLDIY